MSRKEVLALVDQYGPDILLVPGRPDDGATLAPGMPGFAFKDVPRPDVATPKYALDTERVGFRPKRAGLAIIYAAVEAGLANGLEMPGGVYFDAQEDGEPFICGLINEPRRFTGLDATVHAVAADGWEPDPRSGQPNRYGFVLSEPLEWHHANPSGVAILGSAVCRLTDSQLPIANTQGADASNTFYW